MGGPSVPFGAALRRRRLAAGLSTAGLARLIHYSKGYISKVETGLKSPSIDFARRSDAALAAGGELAELVRLAARPVVSGAPVQTVEAAWLPAAAREAAEHPSSGPGSAGVAEVPLGPDEVRSDISVNSSLDVFRTLLESLRELGQTLEPSNIVPMLLPHTTALRQLATRVDPTLSSEVLMLAARFAEYTGWMTQEMGDDVAALRWTDEAVELAQAAGDQDLVAYSYVRRANIALYQQDAYGTISHARQAQDMECAPRVRGLALLREAQGHALAGNYTAFRDCLGRARDLLETGASMHSANRPVLGSTKIPDLVALAEGWSLYDLGRNEEAVGILSQLFRRTSPEKGRAWARIGARLALALASIRELEQACAIVQPVLVMFPTIESATIRYDLRQLSRILSRWSSDASVKQTMPSLSAVLTRTASHSAVPRTHARET
jgi:transcriptional regulator with XRE-family HTH domain/tetratricopeptide (TPR) repeat protein